MEVSNYNYYKYTSYPNGCGNIFNYTGLTMFSRPTKFTTLTKVGFGILCTNIVPSLQPQLLHPQAKLQWKRCADMPVKMSRVQAVVMGGKVYVGGGLSVNPEDTRQVFQYNPSQDEWSHLLPHHVFFFAIAQFIGHLITVGGYMPHCGYLGNVYRFKAQSQKWEEVLKPMPTGRGHLSVATTQSAIVASGGVTDDKDDGKPVPCVTVEVFSSETSQWHTADPLPIPCVATTSVTIAKLDCPSARKQ